MSRRLYAPEMVYYKIMGNELQSNTVNIGYKQPSVSKSDETDLLTSIEEKEISNGDSSMGAPVYTGYSRDYLRNFKPYGYKKWRYKRRKPYRRYYRRYRR